jgi:hypothetical protein
MLRTVKINALSKEWNKEHIRYYRPSLSFRFFKNFGKVNE